MKNKSPGSDGFTADFFFLKEAGLFCEITTIANLFIFNHMSYKPTLVYFAKIQGNRPCGSF